MTRNGGDPTRSKVARELAQHRAAGVISEREHEVLTLLYVNDLSQRQAALALGIARGTLVGLAKRALHKIARDAAPAEPERTT